MRIRPFEIILIAVFAILAIGGLIYLSTMKGEKNAEEQTYGSSVVVWGTVDQRQLDAEFQNIASSDKAFEVVRYLRIEERALENELLNAIADGNPPDLVILPHTFIARFRSKLMNVPFESLSERTFRDSYIDGAEVFMFSDGTYAVPFAVDPLVLYWNRDLFANVGLASPPKTWETLVNETTPMLTKTDSRRNISQSAIGMGEYLNVRNAKEILSMLFLQSGTTIAEEREDKYVVTLNESTGKGLPPAHAALNFYTQFASPVANAFTWSRSLQFDRNAFTAGKLAMYLGFASELSGIEDENPNLSFDIAPVPQAQGATALRSYGTFYGLAIPKTSKNVTGAYLAALKLAGSDIAGGVTKALALTPVHRALYTGVSDDVYGQVFQESALISRGWLDPAPKESNIAFKSMVETITSGRGDTYKSLADTSYTLEELFR